MGHLVYINICVLTLPMNDDTSYVCGQSPVGTQAFGCCYWFGELADVLVHPINYEAHIFLWVLGCLHDVLIVLPSLCPV